MDSRKYKRLETGQRIRALRMKKQMTQSRFAEALDISVNFLSELENGKKGLSEDTIYKICNFCDISSDYLLYGKTETFSSKTIVEIADSLSSEELDILIDYLVSLKKIRNII